MASEFDWNAHPIISADKDESAAPDKADNSKSSFSWDDHPVVPEPHKDKTSLGRAMLVGAGQGSTMNLGEELTAPVVAGGAMIHDAFSSPDNKAVPTLPGGESTWDKYQRLMQTYRDTAREEQAQAQAEHPSGYTGGALLGGLLAPGLGAGKALKAIGSAGKAAEAGAASLGAGSLLAKGAGLATKVAGGAGLGAGLGAVAGAGEATGDLKNRLPGAIEGAKKGAEIGGVVPLLGAGASMLGYASTKVGENPAVEEMVDQFMAGEQGKDLSTKVGRQKAENIVRNKFATQLANDLKTQTSNIGQQIGDKIQEASDSGAKVNITDEVNDAFKKIKEMKSAGSKDSRTNAAAIEDEIKGILGIKDEAKVANGPEGLIKPEESTAPQKYEVDPKVAQELKQTLQDYSPTPGMDASKLKSSRVANELKGSVGEKLNAETGVAEPQQNINPDTGEITEGPSLNKVYGDLKNATERLKIDVSALPNDTRDKITTLLAKLDSPTVTGGNKRAVVEDVIAALKQSDPSIAAKYDGPLQEAVKDLQLAQNTIGGGGRSGFLGTTRAFGSTIANQAGLITNKITGGKLNSVGTGINEAKSFANTVMDNVNPSGARVASGINNPETLSKIKNAQPFEYQRQVATASENAEPDTLKQQAAQVRQQHGNQGEQLATILEKMADQGKDSRRALMFTILQNPAYKKMLGMTGEQVK